MGYFCNSADRFDHINRGVALPPTHHGVAAAGMRPPKVPDTIDVTVDSSHARSAAVMM